MTAEDLTVPLHTVPVGARVMYGEKVWEHYPCQNSSSPCIRQPDAALCWASMPSSTPVLWLDGDAPVPLVECKGWFWDPHPDHGRGVPARWTAINQNVADLTAPDGGGWTQHARSLVWPIHRPEPSHVSPVAPPSSALAERLIADGWTPPAPEPERPTAEALLDGFQYKTDAGMGSASGRHILSAFTEHDYAVVDLHAITDAIKWLRREWRSYGSVNARDLLDAFEVDR